MGISQGYWIVFVTVASEQFGTNLRATVTTTVPNFVRGSTTLTTLLLGYLEARQGLWQAMITVGIICIGLALFSLFKMKETFGKELDYTEQ
jgi:hypothetical protein